MPAYTDKANVSAVLTENNVCAIVLSQDALNMSFLSHFYKMDLHVNMPDLTKA